MSHDNGVVEVGIKTPVNSGSSRASMQPQPPHSSFTVFPLGISTSHSSHSFGFTGVTTHGTAMSVFTLDSRTNRLNEYDSKLGQGRASSPSSLPQHPVHVAGVDAIVLEARRHRGTNLRGPAGREVFQGLRLEAVDFGTRADIISERLQGSIFLR